MIDQKEIGRILRRKRRELGLSQTKLGEKACVSHTTISNIERADRNMTFDSYLTVINALNLEISIADRKTVPSLMHCPFCGGYAHFDTGASYFRESMIYCESCDVWVALDNVYATQDDLAEAWNRRVK